MYCLLISAEDWFSGSYKTLGYLGHEKVIEAEILPDIEYEDISEIPVKFIQACLEPKYGEKLTYQQLKHIRKCLAVIPEGAADYIELSMKYADLQDERLADLEDAIIELDGGGV